MLKTKDDYVFLKNTLNALDIGIKGRIIPTEDIDGSKHPLRRENNAYLWEALLERVDPVGNYVGRGDVTLVGRNLPPKNSAIKKKYPLALGNMVKGLYDYNTVNDFNAVINQNYFCKDDSPSLPIRWATHGEHKSTVFETYRDFLIDGKDSHIEVSSFSENDNIGLSANYLRTCFYDMNRLNTAFIKSGNPYLSGHTSTTLQNYTVAGGRAVVRREGGVTATKAIGEMGVIDFITVEVTPTDSDSMSPQSPYDYMEYELQGKTYLSENYIETKYNFDMENYRNVKSVQLVVTFDVWGTLSGTHFDNLIDYPLEAQYTQNQKHGVDVLTCSYEINHSFLRNLIALSSTKNTSQESSGYSDWAKISIRGDPTALIQYDYKSRLPDEWKWKPD